MTPPRTRKPETPEMVCDLEGDDTCACSTDPKVCRCVADLVCSGPLVGSLIEPEYECEACGSPMRRALREDPKRAGRRTTKGRA